MKVVVNEAAAGDLDGIFDWISKDNPRAAAETVRRIGARINQLGLPGLSQIGRPGLDEGTRELIEPPYHRVSGRRACGPGRSAGHRAWARDRSREQER
jgi:toxin ParE1/3/4